MKRNCSTVFGVGSALKKRSMLSQTDMHPSSILIEHYLFVEICGSRSIQTRSALTESLTFGIRQMLLELDDSTTATVDIALTDRHQRASCRPDRSPREVHFGPWLRDPQKRCGTASTALVTAFVPSARL